MNNIIRRFCNLRSFVTLALTGVFVYLSITRTVDVETFMTVFIMVMQYYFLTKKDE